MPRNPTWQRDELILELDLYFKLDRKVPDETHPEVVPLSGLLNSLPIHADRPDVTHFRNSNGVALKLANFRALDQPGHGMGWRGRGDREVWGEFAGDPTRLAKVALGIRSGMQQPAAQSANTLAALEGDEDEFPEGRVLQGLHQVRERSPRLRKRKKAEALRKHGRLACEACGFDFATTYGGLGTGFIECHHAVPVSEMQPGAVTQLKDVVLLCSNCHRMVHRKRPWLKVGAIKTLVQ